MKKLKLFDHVICGTFLTLIMLVILQANGQTYEYFEKSSMLSPDLAPSACVFDGKIYLTGGSVDGQVIGDDYGSKLLHIYDIASDSWSSGKSMPTKRWMHGSAELNGKIYVIGGGWYNVLSANEVYDPQTNTWDAKSPMPTARGSVCVCTVNNKIYVIGGFVGQSFLATNEMYDPDTDTWAQKAPMSSERSGFATVVVKNKIYAIGGTIMPTSAISSMEVYDPSTDIWTRKASMNHKRFGLAATSYRDGGKDYIVAIGGTNSNFNPSEGYIEIYDIENDTWTELENMPSPSQWGAACSYNNLVYFMGGENMCCMTFPDQAVILDHLYMFDLKLFGVDEKYNETPLLRVYPNPAQSHILINFNLLQNKHVTLEIYNKMGQLIEIISDGFMSSGKHSVPFNSSRLENGTYYLRLQTDEVSSICPVMLLKY